MSEQHNAPQQTQPASNEAQKDITVATIRQTYSGPLPAPADLAGYEAVLKGTAERIITMAEKNAEHRRDIERIAVKSDARSLLLGQIFGFVLALVSIAVSVFLAMNGHEALGCTLATVTIGSAVVSYVTGRKGSKD